MYMRLLLAFWHLKRLCAAGSLGANREMHSACRVRMRDKGCCATTIVLETAIQMSQFLPLGALKRGFHQLSAVPNNISQTDVYAQGEERREERRRCMPCEDMIIIIIITIRMMSSDLSRLPIAHSESRGLAAHVLPHPGSIVPTDGKAYRTGSGWSIRSLAKV